MPPEQLVTAPVIEGGQFTPVAPQVSEPSPQEPSKTQETTPVQVENEDQTASSPKPASKLPASYYSLKREYGRQKALNSDLINRIDRMERLIMESQRPQVKKDQEDPAAALANDPEKWIKSYVESQLETLRNQMKEEIPKTMAEKMGERDQKSQMREALELLFPKSDQNSALELDERIYNDQVKRERLANIFLESGLEEVSLTNPIKAAKSALEIYAHRYGDGKGKKSVANPPTKAQMVSTSTGSMQGGSKMRSEKEILSDMDKLTEQVSDNPALRFDESFMKKWNDVKEEMSTFLTTPAPK